MIFCCQEVEGSLHQQGVVALIEGVEVGSLLGGSHFLMKKSLADLLVPHRVEKILTFMVVAGVVTNDHIPLWLVDMLSFHVLFIF